jgi:hypothetical protein
MIPAEYMGKARELIRCVDREDEKYCLGVDKIEQTAARWVKQRHSCFKPQQLDEFHAMVELLPNEFRLAPLIIDRSKKNLCLLDYRMTSSKMRIEHWENKAEFEESIALTGFEYSFNRASFRFYPRPICQISIHAIARRFQRGRTQDEAFIKTDMSLVLEAQPWRREIGEEFTVKVDAGEWRGRILWSNKGTENYYHIAAARTFVDRYWNT